MIDQKYLAEFIKKIRKDYSLSQTALARILMVDPTLISHYENERKMPSWENISKLCEHFGYELKIVPIETTNRKNYGFYNPKTYQELRYMKNDEVLDYIFVSQDDDVLMNICGLSKDLYKLIPLDTLKNILSNKLLKISRLALYFMINRMYEGGEEEMSYFIKNVKRWLDHNELVTEEMYNKIKYVECEITFESDGGFDEDNFCFILHNPTFLDEFNEIVISENDVRYDYTIHEDLRYFDIDRFLKYNAGKSLFLKAEQVDNGDFYTKIPLYY